MTGISIRPEGLKSIYCIQFLTRKSLSERNSCELSVYIPTFNTSTTVPAPHLSRASNLRMELLDGLPILIPGKKEDKNTSENDLDIIKFTFVIVISRNDAVADKKGEALTILPGKSLTRSTFSR